MSKFGSGCPKTYSPSCKLGGSWQTWFHKVQLMPEGKIKTKHNTMSTRVLTIQVYTLHCLVQDIINIPKRNKCVFVFFVFCYWQYDSIWVSFVTIRIIDKLLLHQISILVSDYTASCVGVAASISNVKRGFFT